MVDFMMRNGFMDTASDLIKVLNLDELVDFNVYDNARKIEDELRQNKYSLILKWCFENRSKLKNVMFLYQNLI